MCGRILDKYNELGGPAGKLGVPTSDELRNPDGVGRRTSFENDSTIYWHPDVDAHQIGGRIGRKWGEFGLEGGALGYPITDELANPDNRGRRQAFQKDSSIYWTASTDAHQIGGAIGKRWGELGWESSYLGYPSTDELPTPNGSARFNHFEQGSVYWSGPTGSHDLTREMMAIWGAFGYETGQMGLPVGNNIADSDATNTLRPSLRGLTATPQRRVGEPQKQVFERAVGRVGTDGGAYVHDR